MPELSNLSRDKYANSPRGELNRKPARELPDKSLRIHQAEDALLPAGIPRAPGGDSGGTTAAGCTHFFLLPERNLAVKSAR